MRKRFILISLLASATLAGILLVKGISIELPDLEMNRARKMLTEAELAKSPIYSGEHYAEASRYYDSAMIEWGQENESLWLFRNYRRTSELAGKSAESSRVAIASTRKNILNLEEVLKFRIYELGERIKEFDEKYGDFPMNKRHRDEISSYKIHYSEGLVAFRNKKYPLCIAKLDSVEIIIDEVFILYEGIYSSYVSEIPDWLKMVDHTLNHSKRNKSYAIVVDKLARECILYKDGKVVDKYRVELGVNWMGDKKQQGDKSTPEGFYTIIAKKNNGQTRFYKALLLDYPNDEDRKRFIQNKKKGVLNPEAKIGNLIEIHGHGGKGIDWTDGCLALKDADMDAIFKLCPVGTKVTIVGTTQSNTQHLSK